MRKHMVTCVSCGKRFNATYGAFYNPSTRRYTCTKCHRQHKKAINANQKELTKTEREAMLNEREERTGMRQSFGAMIAKIVIGALFIITPFTQGGTPEIITGIVIGIGLIAWGLIPYLKARKIKQEEVAAEQSKIEAELNAPKKCSACGATTKGDKCEYCGSPLE